MIIAQYSDQVVPENQAIDERLFDHVGHRDVYRCGDGGGLIFDGNDVELIGPVKRVTGSEESPQQ